MISRMALGMVVLVKFLYDSCSIFDNLRITIRQVLSKWLYCVPNIHVLEHFTAFFINAKITNREQSNTSRRLRRTLVISNHLEKLSQSSMLNQIFAQSIGVANEIT